MKTENIVHENGFFTVTKGLEGYVVQSNLLIGVIDSVFALTPDGLSLARARCDYLSSRYSTAIDVGRLQQKMKMNKEK